MKPWRENSNISNFLPLKIVNFDRKIIKLTIFEAFQEFVFFGPPTHCAWALFGSFWGFNDHLAVDIQTSPVLTWPTANKRKQNKSINNGINKSFYLFKYRPNCHVIWLTRI